MLETAAGTRYHALIIPGSGNMPANVKAHIDDLKQQGANIIYGTSTTDMAKCAKPELMRCGHGLRAIRRSNTTGHHYFIANLSPNDMSARLPLSIDFKDARWFNPLNGEIYKADITPDGIQIDLKSGESMILQTYDHELQDTSEVRPLKTTGMTKELNGRWTLTFDDSAPKVEKTFTLDKPQTWETLDDDSVKITMGTGVYTTHVKMSKQEAQSHWVIDLGDVRESARVYINDNFIGCAWSVPFVLNCKDTFRTGDNTIRIEVTNLPANRIADLDRRNVKWRKFNEINVVSINYKKTGYGDWKPVESGLNSLVKLIQLK